MFCPGMQWEVYLDGFESSGKRVTIQGVRRNHASGVTGDSPRDTPGRLLSAKVCIFFRYNVFAFLILEL